MSDSITDNPTTTTYKPEKQKREVPVTRVLTIFAGFFALLAIVGKFYYSFYIFDETYYAKVFYSWRTGFANKQMYADTWKYIASNKYDKKKTPDYYKLIKYAQIDQNLFDGHPEHYPRQQNGYFSHGGDNKFNIALNKWRSDVNKVDERYNEEVYTGKQLLTDKMKLFWTGTDKKNENDAIYYYENTDQKVKEFVWELVSFLNKIHEGFYSAQNATIGKTVDERILKDIMRIVDKTGYVFREAPAKGQKPSDAPRMNNEKALDALKVIILDMVNAKAKTGPCFAFSRAMNAIVFALVKKDLPIYEELEKKVEEEAKLKAEKIKEMENNDAPSEKIKEEKEKKGKAEETLDKMKNSGAYRLERIAQCITYLLVKLCEHPYDTPMKNKNAVVLFFEKMFGPQYIDYYDDTEALNAIIKGLNETIGFAYDEKNPDPEFKFTKRPIKANASGAK